MRQREMNFLILIPIWANWQFGSDLTKGKRLLMEYLYEY